MLWNSESDTSAAAPPPTPLNSATICGIAVIFTRRARDGSEHAADQQPDDDLPVASIPVCANVTTIAISIPARRSGCRSARAPATRGTAARG